MASSSMDVGQMPKWFTQAPKHLQSAHLHYKHGRVMMSSTAP